MNKVGCFLCFSLMTVNAWATEMCARNDTIVIPLDAKIIADDRADINTFETLWRASFEYGYLYGTAACLSKKEIMMYNNGNIPTINTPIKTSADELLGAYGYYMNADTDPAIPDSEKPEYKRTYCIGKITHPVSTMWIYVGQVEENCINSCIGKVPELAYSWATQVAIRDVYFQNIAIEQPK